MKVVEREKEENKMRVYEVGGGKVFRLEGRFYIRLYAAGALNGSVNSGGDCTHIGDLEDGEIKLIPDNTMVEPLNAEVHIWSE